MKIFLKWFFLFFIFPASCFADKTAATDLIALLNNVQSMKADFTQTLYNNRGKATQKSYGHMALKRPGKFRWDINKPQPQLIIANETKLWIYDPDLEQLTIRSLEKTSGETPALLLSHDNASLEKHYVIDTVKREPAAWRWFSLKSKAAESMFQNMQMGFMNNQIREMRLEDNLGHTTIVQFQNIQTNVNLPASLFTIKPSSKVDVIDETRKKS